MRCTPGAASGRWPPRTHWPPRSFWSRRGRGNAGCNTGSTLAWGLLFVNVLTFAPHQSVIPIPNTVGKLITQGSLPLAIVVALTVNRRVIVRPNVFLCLLSLLVSRGDRDKPAG